MHEVPLLSCSGIPCVELTSSKVNVMRVAIDLASVNAYLNAGTAKDRGLPMTPWQSANGKPIAELQQTTVPGARIGDVPLGDFPFVVTDIGTDQTTGKKKDVWFPADGALAMGSFQNRRVQLDFNRHVLRISDPLTDALPCPRDCGELKSQPSSPHGPLTLVAHGFEIEGQPVSAQIDTMFTGTMLVYPSTLSKLDTSTWQRSKHKEEFPFAQGGVKLLRAQPVDYTFDKDPLLGDAPVYLWNEKESAAPPTTFDVTTGTTLLSRALFTFDFRAWKVWMEPATGSE